MSETSEGTDPFRRMSVRIGDLGSVAAAVPLLMGYAPTDSLIVVSHDRQQPPQIGMTARIDLLAPGLERECAGALASRFDAESTAGVFLVAVGSAQDDPQAPSGGWTEPGPAGPPYRALIEAVSEKFDKAGIAVLDALWVPRLEGGQAWWSYEGARSDRLPEPGSTPLAAAYAVAGRVTYGSREELIATLRPLDADVLSRTGRLLAARIRSAGESPEEGVVAKLRAAMEEPGSLLGSDACERVAELAAALEWPGVRDACVKFAFGVKAHEAQALWAVLTKATPAPFRARPASLLALTAYARGDGALARIACELAMKADPTNYLAETVAMTLALGVSPAVLREAILEGVSDSELPT
jgi:hypothetical protein